jgi:hypothetical protein
MKQKNLMSNTLLGGAAAVVLGICTTLATADEPCGDLEECRAFIEINASDGDIGFHVLLDAEGWQQARIIDPDGKIIFHEQAHGPLKDQKLTENFFESAEPLCEEELVEEGEDDEVVTLPEFLERFPAGPYQFRNKLEGGEELAGITMFTHKIPAAPVEVDFDGSVISWEYGDDLDACTTFPEGFMLAEEGDIVGYEVVLEPEDDALGSFKFTVQVPSDVNSVTVSAEYLSSLDANTPLKVEVGAIERRFDALLNESFGNTTFTEEDGFCNTKKGTCPGE